MKEYIVFLKHNAFKYYIVEAPSKRIAKWAALNLFSHDYCMQISIKDLVAYRKREDV